MINEKVKILNVHKKMNLGFEDLNKTGIKGVVTFWLRCLLFLLTLSLSAFSFYWMAITATKIWTRSINSSLLVANLFLALITLASFAFLLLSRLNIKIVYSVQFTHHVFVVLSFIGQVICCILMSLSTPSSSETYHNSITDFCSRYPSDPVVTNFIASHNTEFAIISYVASRSTDLYPSIAAFFGIWFASTVIYIACSSAITDRPEQSPLLNDQQQNVDSPISLHKEDNENRQNVHENLLPSDGQSESYGSQPVMQQHLKTKDEAQNSPANSPQAINNSQSPGGYAKIADPPYNPAEEEEYEYEEEEEIY
ncbi:hypothetical protein TRFO_07007 [Tritrichomonas foetus]|uniref:Uncharacterized protein n=1 Tax=Tritrichomonas foetus TaxID=1144522 RepID=A0A1J4JYM3_9EUKA|nr:hypothetical protein TRFO_07007 [Tritrichomonas foetus]|eukprot:OHT02598.1 hypothetical protein TRFO_07007 [Tritrichomonas foetus]